MQPGRRAHKRHHGIDYELQATQHLSASGTIDTVYDRIFDNLSQSSHKNVAIQSVTTSCTIDLEQSTTQPGKITISVCWSSTTKVKHLTLPIPLLNFLCVKFDSKIHICTQCKRDKFTFP
jgi:hypothetical protein